jgi:pimeloyl-ACP methyl ester carboxylesterase
MATFDSAGVQIAYDQLGGGRPVVLVHGFAADRVTNWKAPGWYDLLRDAGYRVAALDCRGHGASDKLYDPDAYGLEKMGGDVLRMMDLLGIERALLMGYSMGAMISSHLLLHHTDRFERVVLGGVGGGMLQPRSDSDVVAAGLEAEDPASLTDVRAKAFRAFADQSNNDRRALAACMRRPRQPLDTAALANVRTPVLVVAGANDTLVGDPAALAAAIPGAKSVVVPGRDHLTAVGDRVYKNAVLSFFAEA